ncbi:MAG: GIY-YIG nuclease family protein [Candidatus Kapabacteria bacterium]|nr:GIY-YIG nuclease family protein [Candidatus Kapabacteria bacterium]
MKKGYVYIMASKKYGTLYTGVTSNLLKRIYEHKNNLIDGFTKKYSVHTLVYFEDCGNILQAIKREKQIKGWNRYKKIKLIESIKKNWEDLSKDWYNNSINLE